MIELRLALDAIPQNLQAIGALIPILSCCYVQLKKSAVVKYFKTFNYPFGEEDVETYAAEQYNAHDHRVGKLRPKKDELVVLIPDRGHVNMVLFNRDDVITIDSIKEGERIRESEFKHKHSGKIGEIGPWEH